MKKYTVIHVNKSLEVVETLHLPTKLSLGLEDTINFFILMQMILFIQFIENNYIDVSKFSENFYTRNFNGVMDLNFLIQWFLEAELGAFNTTQEQNVRACNGKQKVEKDEITTTDQTMLTPITETLLERYLDVLMMLHDAARCCLWKHYKFWCNNWFFYWDYTPAHYA